METAPAVLWDAVVVPAGDDTLAGYGQAVDFVKEQYRHCKPILALGAPGALVAKASLPEALVDGGPDAGFVTAGGADAITSFVAACGQRRFFERETDPPRV